MGNRQLEVENRQLLEEREDLLLKQQQSLPIV